MLFILVHKSKPSASNTTCCQILEAHVAYESNLPSHDLDKLMKLNNRYVSLSHRNKNSLCKMPSSMNFYLQAKFQ